MKKITVIQTLLLLFFTNVQAQVNLTLAFNSRPLPFLSDWNKAVNGLAVVTVTGATNITAIKFKAILTNEDGVDIGVTNAAAANLFSLNAAPATSTFTLGDVLQLQNMQFNSSAQSLIQQSGRLRAGTYKLTVQVLNAQGVFITEKFSFLTVTGYQLPVPIFPNNGAELDAHVASNIITFRWTRLIPVQQDLPIYRIQVFEIYNFQTPMQALRSNMPLLNEVATRGATQFIWRTNLPMMDTTANRRFIWTLQTLDGNGAPIPTMDMNQQGRSEPAVFTIINQSANREKVKAEVKEVVK
jgi:hypothetical protein